MKFNVCNGNMSPIISLKAEHKVEIIHWKIKKHTKKIVMYKYVNFSFTCVLSNVEGINFLLPFSKRF